ncbi:hypothetical protein DEO72_LG1g2884 [Vigna unguiculata]|uniref:Transposase n=1 Tax=Vigna unguiculata TaxID=3917 RepID=A0A4D6KRT1_VIGUN|nr:hypothetical protein DEO72_LG1g2884 [Vigna unguiculata]
MFTRFIIYMVKSTRHPTCHPQTGCVRSAAQYTPTPHPSPSIHTGWVVASGNRTPNLTFNTPGKPVDATSCAAAQLVASAGEPEVLKDPPEELEESNWPAKGGYGWAAADVREQSSLFRWSRLLNSWLNCTLVISKGVSGDIVSLERVSAIDRVCHGQEGATEKFFYMYMCHFSQLHVQLSLDDFTMGVLWALNVAPTQLHPNSWAYLQAFSILCQSLYLEPTPYAFLYFYDTRPQRPATWLSLISRPSISRLDAFSKYFKHFKDGYFKVVVKEGGKTYILNADGSAKFPFSWTNNPSRYKDMGMDELSADDKEVVETLLKYI